MFFIRLWKSQQNIINEKLTQFLLLNLYSQITDAACKHFYCSFFFFYRFLLSCGWKAFWTFELLRRIRREYSQTLQEFGNFWKLSCLSMRLLFSSGFRASVADSVILPRNPALYFFQGNNGYHDGNQNRIDVGGAAGVRCVMDPTLLWP